MNYEKLREESRRLERTRDVLEQRQDRFHEQFYPVLKAWLGDPDARGAGIRSVRIGEKIVEIMYSYWQRGEPSSTYSLTLGRSDLESSDPVTTVRELRREHDKEQTNQERADRIARLQRELSQLEDK